MIRGEEKSREMKYSYSRYLCLTKNRYFFFFFSNTQLRTRKRLDRLLLIYRKMGSRMRKAFNFPRKKYPKGGDGEAIHKYVCIR